MRKPIEQWMVLSWPPLRYGFKPRSELIDITSVVRR
jgi:hypothetical protein